MWVRCKGATFAPQAVRHVRMACRAMSYGQHARHDKYAPDNVVTGYGDKLFNLQDNGLNVQTLVQLEFLPRICL